MTAASPSLFLEVTHEARAAARRIVREARHAMLACLEPVTSDPLASRVAAAPDMTGDPVILVSRLSAHTSALMSDPRASLLFGHPGPGDPLAHPRVSVRGRAEHIDADHLDHVRVRRRFLARMPKARLYVDFPDFAFIRIAVSQALFNGGFARAYRMERGDLTEVVEDGVCAAQERVRQHMNEDHSSAVDDLVSRQLGRRSKGWRIGTIDILGFDAVKGDRVVRVEFACPVTHDEGFRQAFVDLVAASGIHQGL